MSRDDFNPPSFEEMPMAEQFRKLQEQVQKGIREHGKTLTPLQLEAIDEHVEEKFRVAGKNLARSLDRLNRGHKLVWGSILDKEPEPDKASDESARKPTD